MTAQSEEKYALLDRLAEEFVERWRCGERPALQEFIDRHGDLADDIRELFPALVEMAHAEPDGRTSGEAPAVALKKVGEYRILREVGHGGMGVVYEAEQTSLGRRVALKVLAPFATNEKALGRFHREARAAAKLHHTNIVPVFEVGQDGDLCYYAMQFIQGQSLDQVIEELGRLRARSANRARPVLAETAASCENLARVHTGAVSDITRSLFIARAPAAQDPTTSEYPSFPDTNASSDVVASSAVLPGRMSLSGVESNLRHFFQSVARIGEQVASALCYAHERGILHRDVKPSNLLLDEAGVVWVADFGLAKTDDDGLTATGDVIGTFRYMSPERFSGRSDATSDVYALGLTLYELLTLRPAFDARDRIALIAQIQIDEPPRPRALDPRIPRDLETIVLKATAKEPKQRYQAAADMANDLKRFLADEPIHARRTGTLQRLRLWRRRNPALAALSAGVLFLLLAVAAGSTATAFYLNATLAESEQHRLRAEEAETQGKHKLWQADLDHAQARRMSRRPGQRFAALRSIQEAVHLPTPPGRSIDELRTEAIAALCLPDIEVEKEWNGMPQGSVWTAFDPDFERYARADKAGNVTVRRVRDDAELFALPAPPGAKPVSDNSSVKFSPDGRLLQQHCQTANWFRSRVWRLDGLQPVLVLDDDHFDVAFRPDGRQFAANYSDGTVRLFDAASGDEVRRYPSHCPQPEFGMSWNPTGASLLLALPTYLGILDLDTGKVSECQATTIHTSVNEAFWSPSGYELGICGRDNKIYVWDVAADRLVPPPLSATKAGGLLARFSPSGDRLLNTDWSSLWVLWDARTGRRLLSLPVPGLIQFSRDGRSLAAPGRLFRYAEGTEFRSFSGGNIGAGSIGTDVAVDAAGRLLTVHTAEGIALIDLNREARIGMIRLPNCSVVAFEPDGSLLTQGTGGLVRWKITIDAASGQRSLGSPQRLAKVAPNKQHSSSSTNGKVVAVADGGGSTSGALLLHPSGSPAVRLGPQQDVRRCAVSPDGRWVATSSHWLDRGDGVKIWDGDTGRFVRDLPIPFGSDYLRFSPDGRWLLTTGQRPRIWKCDGWEEGPPLHGDPLNPFGVFSADGRLLALGDAPGVVRLLDPESGRELARVTAPEDARLYPVAFTPDGARLIVYNAESFALALLDLRAIRAELVELGLDWDAPPYPPADVSDKVGPPPPIKVDDAVGELLNLVKADSFVEQAFKDWQGKNYTEAAKKLRNALKIDADLAIANNNLAWALLAGPPELRDPNEALTLARKAVERLGDDPHQTKTLGVALYRNDRYDEAVAVLEKSLATSKDETVAIDLFFLAMCRHRLGDADAAKKDRDRAVAWVRDNGKTLSAVRTEELAAFQIETDAVIAQRPGANDR
jgi:eukaryotic-like serine/threonine-protein kinase